MYVPRLHAGNYAGPHCCDIGQQTNVDWIRVVMVSLVSNETNTDVRMYT